MEETSLLESDDYYAWLALGKRASAEEISNAYRKMSRLFHPDKHASNEKAQADAQNLFTKIKKAYEVLSDPHKRAIYDTVGVKGLETDGWQVVSREKTPAEILQEYERLKQEEEERKLQQKTNPSCQVTAEIDATDVFDRYEVLRALEYGSRIPNVELSQMSVAMSVDCPLTTKDTVVLGANVSIDKSVGAGAVAATYRRVLSENTWAEGRLSLGNHGGMEVKGFRRLWRSAFGTMSGSLQLRPRGFVPIWTTVAAQQISKHVQGRMVLTLTPRHSSLQTLVAYDDTTKEALFAVQLGVPNCFVMMKFDYKIPDYDLVFKIQVKVGTMSSSVECGCSKKITKFSTVAASVSVSVPHGVKLKLKLFRGNQAFIVPIHLSEHAILEPVFYGTVVPLLSYTIIKVFIVNPFLRSEEEKDLNKRKEANATRLAQKKREAEATLDLMTETIERSFRVEIEKHGLVIKKAMYGKLNGENTDEQDVINATIQVQALVKDSKLSLAADTKLSELPGFYDPCIGEDKQLLITYLFRDQLHVCQFQESDRILIPSREHLSSVSPTT